MGPETINFSMKETPRRRVTVTSSLAKIYTDQPGKEWLWWGLLDRYIKTTGTVFSPPRIFASWLLHPPPTLQLPSADTHTHTGPYADNSGPFRDDYHSTCLQATACVFSQGQNKAVKNFALRCSNYAEKKRWLRSKHIFPMFVRFRTSWKHQRRKF